MRQLSVFGFVTFVPFHNATRQTQRVVCRGETVTTEFGANHTQDQIRSDQITRNMTDACGIIVRDRKGGGG